MVNVLFCKQLPTYIHRVWGLNLKHLRWDTITNKVYIIYSFICWHLHHHTAKTETLSGEAIYPNICEWIMNTKYLYEGKIVDKTIKKNQRDNGKIINTPNEMPDNVRLYYHNLSKSIDDELSDVDPECLTSKYSN